VAATGATEVLLRFCDRLSPLLPYFEFVPRPVLFSPPAALLPSTLPRYPALPRDRVPRLHPRASTGINSETPEETTCRGSRTDKFCLGRILPNVTSSLLRVNATVGEICYIRQEDAYHRFRISHVELVN